jgi:GNAT superfamily N-acetyltransferase
MNHEPIIRAATALDAVNILKLFRNEGYWQKRLESSEFDVLAHIIAVLRYHRVYVADLNGRIFASIAMRPHVAHDGARFLDVEWYTVLPTYRSRGLPDLMFREAERIADTLGSALRFREVLGDALELNKTRLRAWSIKDGAYERRARERYTAIAV